MNSYFLIFFSIVAVIFFSVNSYIFLRGLQALSFLPQIKIYYIVLFWLMALTFFAGRILENSYPSAFTDLLVWIGSIWLAIMLYAFLSILLIDIVRAANHYFNFLPKTIYLDYNKTKFIALVVVVLIITVTIVAGYINFNNPRIASLKLDVDKKVENIKTLNIVMASDIHMGTIVSNGRVTKLVNMINKLNPDIVLLPGDVFDEDLEPVIRRNLGNDINKIKAKYGVYAVNGNHEFIGGAESAVKYMEDHGIKVLRDSAVLIANSFYIVGREDRSVNRIKPRKQIEEIINNCDNTKPMILLDHQPFHLEESQKAGIDLQLSGHTHHGQLWPFNYITEKVYEVSWGYKLKGKTHVYVSSGASGWGPPVRTGSRTEIVNIVLKFK